jgi:hypothetical protein
VSKWYDSPSRRRARTRRNPIADTAIIAVAILATYLVMTRGGAIVLSDVFAGLFGAR